MKSISGLYVIVDTSITGIGNATSTAREMISGGAKIIQLRGNEAGGGELLAIAKEIRRLTLKSKATFIINDRVDIALLSRADGVHLGQDDLPVKEARALMGEDAIIGLSTHNEAEALSLAGSGADYISLGPIFKTTTKLDAEEPKGLAHLERVAIALKEAGYLIPVVAIGGITRDSAPDVIEAGAASVAIISDILDSKDRTLAVSSIIKAIKA